MRPLEWLLLVSFIPVLLLPFVPQARRRIALFLTAPLPLLVSLFQIAVEGWRIQIVPLYGLALLILLSRLPELLGRAVTGRFRRGVWVSFVMALMVIGCGILAGWLLPVVTLPAPTGPYRVGVTDRALMDDERGRRLIVSVWYPTAQDGPPAPWIDAPDAVIAGLADSFGFPSIVLQHLRYVTTAAGQDVPLLTSETPFPVLVFSHGLVGLRLQNSTTLQELAGWGYIVVALDHTDAAAVTVFPDSEVRPFDLEKFGITYVDDAQYAAQINDVLFSVWVADQRFVYDTLEQWAVNDPMFAGRLDLTRIASFGHSFGGATSLEVCRVDTRCQAAVNLDGGLYGGLLTEPPVRPLMLMSAAETMQTVEEAVDEWRQMVDRAAADAYWLELPHSTHFSFTLTQLLSPILVPDNFEPRRGLSIIDRYVRAFFDEHVRGLESPLLTPTTAEPEVRWLFPS